MTRFCYISLILCLPFLSQSATFVDVSEVSGLTAVTYAGSKEKNHLLESTGNGAAFFDYDRDGYADIYLVNGWEITEGLPSNKGTNILYRNLGDGTFEDQTINAGVGDDSWGCGVCVADFNGDGWLDLYVTNFGPNCLYKNNGDGTFSNIAERVGVANGGWSVGATFFDADKDNDLDLYVVNYVDCSISDVLAAKRTLDWQSVEKVMVGPKGLKGGIDAFYQNDGSGNFTEKTSEVGLIDIDEFYGLGVCATDYDLDGDTDLFVANDASANYLYQNDGSGVFIEIGSLAGASYGDSGEAQACMGVDFADYDSDGDFDGWVTNFTGECSSLYRNMDGFFFENATKSVGLWQSTYLPMSWGTGFFDFDNDADLDLFIANGHIYPQVNRHPEYGQTYAQTNQIFSNDNGTFIDISKVAGEGLQVSLSSRGTAFADYDNDGDIDILVVNMDAPPTLLRNETRPSQNWLIVQVENRSVIGVKVIVQTKNLKQIREGRSGSSYASQNNLRFHFGLGKNIEVELVKITWLSGRSSEFTDVAANQILKIDN
ncbi:TPA: CRTAC1 family protein [Candidatus Poribacteria bacterium]|nr:CRTAC1 family protein [Candidatus Poribacteria bacterium]